MGFEISGNQKSWREKDFVAFDEVGDCHAETGDITSVFSRKEKKNLFVRITFDDMATRKNNKFVADNFSGKDIILKLEIASSNFKVEKTINISDIYLDKNGLAFLRTPENNLLEMKISIPKNWEVSDLSYHFSILLNNKIIDEFQGKKNKNFRGGNCAFVHHGNQGLTYTEVFYGQFPQDTSGFDEVLQVHQATGIPGNFHMSGTLMPAAQWHNPEFNDWLAAGVQDGWICMLSSALGQHIMPFVQNEMNNWAVSIENDMVEYRYNYVPKVAWIPERVWLSQGHYPDAGITDPWLGDNWQQHGIEAIILDDSPHCDGVSNLKFHRMSNGSGIDLKIIPINNEFVGDMMYDVDAAKNLINSTGQYGIAVYGTDWEVAAEMNEHHNTFFLDNYENVIWYCHDNYPAINVWKLNNALTNTDFLGNDIEITNGTYYLLGGYDGYGGGNNGWYIDWASSPSHSDFHNPAWNYGFIWNNAFEHLMSCPNNSLSQLGWYTLMINLHETGWHDGGEISGWEHRYSSHIKNANVYAEAAHWANGEYAENSAAYWEDIDRDGIDELIMHNEKTFFVFETIGGRAAWIFAKDEFGNMYSVVGSDVAYFSETDGDYNESSNNHFAALSEVSPNYQNDIYNIEIVQGSGDELEVNFTKDNLTKSCRLETGTSYLEIEYTSTADDVYIKSGWTPDLLDLIWNGKTNIQRMWGENGSYCGRRNSASGATAAFVLGEGGAVHSTEFEGTLVLGDEIHGNSNFKVYLYAGYTSAPYDEYNNRVVELDELAEQIGDDIPPAVFENSAFLVGDNKLQIVFTEPVTIASAENTDNYDFQDFNGNYSLVSAQLTHLRNVTLTINETFQANDFGTILVNNVYDLNGNLIDSANNNAEVTEIIKPHLVGTFNGWNPANHDYDLILQNNGLWEKTVNLNVGTTEYKVLESNAWNGHDYPNNNQIISLSEPAEVTFYVNCGVIVGYESGDKFVFHSTNPPVVCGDFLSEIGGTDWNVQTILTQMNDDGIGADETANDGIYSFQTEIPQGYYEYKIVLNNNWDQNTTYSNNPLNLISDSNVTFFYNMVENIISTHIAGTSAENNELSSEKIHLQIFPNPFTTSTVISFSISNEQNQRKTISIYNIKGQKVRTLRQTLECINHVDAKATESLSHIIWNGKDDNGKLVSTGIYFINLRSGNKNLIKKALLTK